MNNEKNKSITLSYFVLKFKAVRLGRSHISEAEFKRWYLLNMYVGAVNASERPFTRLCLQKCFILITIISLSTHTAWQKESRFDRQLPWSFGNCNRFIPANCLISSAHLTFCRPFPRLPPVRLPLATNVYLACALDALPTFIRFNWFHLTCPQHCVCPLTYSAFFLHLNVGPIAFRSIAHCVILSFVDSLGSPGGRNRS